MSVNELEDHSQRLNYWHIMKSRSVFSVVMSMITLSHETDDNDDILTKYS